MARELGKIEKPEAENFKLKRKLFMVPLLYAGKDAPPEYLEKYKKFWEEVAQQIENLEAKVGRVNRIYHESLSMGGEQGLEILEKLNPDSCRIVRQKCQNKALLEAVEDREMAEESMDWERCLLIGFITEKVAKKVSEFYMEAHKRRYEHIGKRIDETLKPDETAILFIREGHMVQFPKDIEVFSVAPPVLDEIHRWLRSRPLLRESEDSKEGETTS
ncbi:MAG: hypothetical protein FJ008_01375 [Chloroflexi bacterium]|nr:hypothetical protein [Chloroflexota bacterium]MBM3172813.1 hypothetical protein [Chloroflexota bacterium]MBM3175740.1 hypothetical protein [Chloroflexota bacterium]MBM4450462.1 hypothetical protein [Chloroflexota bacterium]